jgi:diguanylate cyclase (GGDEF)-like protein
MLLKFKKHRFLLPVFLLLSTFSIGTGVFVAYNVLRDASQYLDARAQSWIVNLTRNETHVTNYQKVAEAYFLNPTEAGKKDLKLINGMLHSRQNIIDPSHFTSEFPAAFRKELLDVYSDYNKALYNLDMLLNSQGMQKIEKKEMKGLLQTLNDSMAYIYTESLIAIGHLAKKQQDSLKHLSFTIVTLSIFLLLSIFAIATFILKLNRQRFIDVLTGLPNRVLLADRLLQAMSQCRRRNQALAVAFLDLDGFKAVNDAHGHDMGDKLLVALSQRMKEALREGDTLARIGGDEFIAVMVDLEKIEDSEPVLERLLKVAAESVTLGDAVLQVSASIGVAIYPQDGVDADQLIRHADQAMYIAKQTGKNHYHLFDT